MDRSKEMIWIFSLAAAVLSAAVLIFSFGCRTASPALLRTDPGTAQQVQAMMETVLVGDFADAGDFFYGQPDLGRIFPEDNTILKALCPALWESMDYRLNTACRTEGTALAMDLTIEAMDAGKVLNAVQPEIEALMEEDLDDIKRYKEIFQEDGSYQDAYIDDVVSQALSIAIENAPIRSETVTVHLSLDGGQWKILPEDALLSALTGWITAT